MGKGHYCNYTTNGPMRSSTPLKMDVLKIFENQTVILSAEEEQELTLGDEHGNLLKVKH